MAIAADKEPPRPIYFSVKLIPKRGAIPEP